MNNICKKEILSWFKKKNIILNEKIDIFSTDKIDSFGFIELLIFIEKKYKIKINHKSIYSRKKLTIKDLVTIIEKSANRKIKKK